MGFLNKIKKSLELKQNIPNSETIHNTEKKRGFGIFPELRH